MMKSNDRRATAELLIALVEAAIAHGRRHYSKSGEPLATTLAVLECLQREDFVTVEAPATPLNLARSAPERVPRSCKGICA
jgi:hypothetical protein